MAGADFVTVTRAATGVKWSFSFRLGHLASSFHFFMGELAQGALSKRLNGNIHTY
jgi:hypothetical protein